MEFTVLERSSSIAFDVGASLVLGPSSLRIFHQLGLLDQLRDSMAEIGHKMCFTPEGYEFKNNPKFFVEYKKK
jgi:2-polyprenyl-6-methoxyphenol hydroxylase-like FAD-dependent oxidoreductase